MFNHSTLFYYAHGRRHYLTFSRYELPNLSHVTDDNSGDYWRHVKVPFTDKRSGKTVFHRDEFALDWPWQMSRDRALSVYIPYKHAESWAKVPKRDNQGPAHYSIGEILKNGWLPEPEEVAPDLAYFLAVNHDVLGLWEVPYPVCGLPAKRVQQVLDARLAPDDTGRAGIEYLKWLAESHRDHPFLRHFDTCVRDKLGGVGVESARLFFYLISDYLYNPEDQWWDRDGKSLWQQMAVYLHWVGRTGGFWPGWHAGLMDGAAPVEFLKECAPDLHERLQEWEDSCRRTVVAEDQGDEG